MRKIVSAIIAFVMGVQLFAVVPVSAENENIGKPYTEPDSPATTYNMNLDWKFYDTHTDVEIWTAMAKADKNGKKFYEVGYDDSEWETVSIPHGIGGGTNSFGNANQDAGGGYRSVLLYRKTFTVPQTDGKVFFELEGIRQAAYVWVNGQEVGYYEAGITAMGFDITNYVTSGQEAVIAICNDGTTDRGTSGRVIRETVPGAKWGSMGGVGYVWNTKDFNEPQIGLVYDAYLHVKGKVYQTLPLYNNLKTTGNYIYADNFDIKGQSATIHVDAEVRNESDANGEYSLEVAVVDADGNLTCSFESAKKTVAKATDKGEVYQTAVESNVYDAANTAKPQELTKVNTPDVEYIKASFKADGMRFWTTDDPYLYTVYTILKDGAGNVVDVQKKETGFRKVTYDDSQGVLINDRPVWLTGYAQRSTNEWAVIGSATDWLQDYDMQLLKENNSNFIRWMHVAPKPAEVRSADRYGVVVVCPAGDKEGVGLDGRAWAQRTEAMRDAMIYFRNSPSVLFWETGNSDVGSAANANDMARVRDLVDPHGMRFLGARSTTAADQMKYDNYYVGTMLGARESHTKTTPIKNTMKSTGQLGPIMETEYSRDEAPRRVWDEYSPPDYDYINKWISVGGKKDKYDVWNWTQEGISVSNVKSYYDYYSNRAGVGLSLYSADAMMIWSDSNMHTRNCATENCRTSGRVDPVRQKKEMFEATKVAHSSKADVHIIGHWSYPEVSEDTYNHYGTNHRVLAVDANGKETQGWDEYDINKPLAKRDPTKKTVYVIGSEKVSKVELYRVDGETETLLKTDEKADNGFVYQFDGINVTVGDAVIAKAYDSTGTEVAKHEIKRTYDAATLKLEVKTAVAQGEDGGTVPNWRADGSDIAFVDVKVVDRNGNVCALNYDKIDFKWSGEGVYLGGYNSGMGADCYQNTPASQGLSNYFGGAKDGVSTLGKNYVYAENGTNRIFIRSTRTAGKFTLTASMDGILPVSVDITSTPVTTEGGLTTLEQSIIRPGTKEPPKVTNVPVMRPLMLGKKLIDWADIKKVVIEDTTDYHDVYLNGTKLELSARAYKGAMDTMFGPLKEILDAVIAAGNTSVTYTYQDVNGRKELVISANGHTYQYLEGRNQVVPDGNEAEQTETVVAAYMEGDTLIVNLTQSLAFAGIAATPDDSVTPHRLNITTGTGGAN